MMNSEDPNIFNSNNVAEENTNYGIKTGREFAISQHYNNKRKKQLGNKITRWLPPNSKRLPWLLLANGSPQRDIRPGSFFF